MPQQNGLYLKGGLLNSLFSEIDGERAERIISTYGSEELEGVFSNKELTGACLCLFENDLNVSLTASKLYMHRNTLIYGINKIKRLCGLDLRKFSDAVTFLLLYALRTAKNGGLGDKN